jgi:hypothetical protein
MVKTCEKFILYLSSAYTKIEPYTDHLGFSLA